MSDDLIKLLRHGAWGGADDDTMKEAADRIEALTAELGKAWKVAYDATNRGMKERRMQKEAEAKLAKAVEALRFYAPQTAGGITFLGGDDAGKRAADVLAELEAKE